jgi:hypothetical protein
MADQPNDQLAPEPVKWGLAVGMLLLIGLIVVVAAGVLDQGSNSGDGTSGTGDLPTSLPSTPSSSDVLAQLAGIWRAPGGLTLRISPEGSYSLTQRGNRLDEGHVDVTGARGPSLISESGGKSGQLTLAPPMLVLESPQVGLIRFTRIA